MGFLFLASSRDPLCQVSLGFSTCLFLNLIRTVTARSSQVHHNAMIDPCLICICWFFCLVEALPVLILPTLCSLFPLSLSHRMSDEEAQFGTESPDPNNLVDVPGPSQKKGTGKGGKPKGENNARAIPASVRRRLGYDTPPDETFQQRRNRLQSIRRYWAVRWYKYKSVQDWKWAMQFACNPPYQYTMAMRSSYSPEN